MNDFVVAEGDIVMLHGRYSGTALPRNSIAADVVRMCDGMMVEHWDVLQDEVTKEESQSGRAMFGESFASTLPSVK